MKRIFTLLVALGLLTTSFAQTDTTGTKKVDTIRIGGLIIIRKPGEKREIIRDKEYKTSNKRQKPANVSTNWFIVDLGFSNFSDKTDYASAAAQSYAPGSNKSWLDLKDGRSRNVNIWFFMQKRNLLSHVVNLKYGLGLELNNYHFEQNIRFQKNTGGVANPTRLIMDATPNRHYDKNKLAADYLTVPVMLNFNFTPDRRRRSFGLSAGVSAGYLYASRNKVITSDEGKRKIKNDFELEKWKVSYIAELSLGPIRLYGSYAAKNMFERGLDVTPYNFGIRLSNW